MEAKAFPTADVLGIVTDRLLGDIGGIYKVLSWMSGEDVYTHQIPRICREAEPIILAMHPELAHAVQEAEQVTPENFRGWLTKWAARYGGTITVPRLTTEQHERIDPLSELCEMVPPDHVAAIAKAEGR